ncbi:MAG TPA: DUF167 domain-containing protein [Candidatus Magasanikbacteria bacterium]|nr:DUF167 domain-containing protein [Candidatus Magasanikbacteria bacterium]
MRLKIKITPRASRNEIVGQLPDGTLRIRVTAPPVDGEANEKLIELLSEEYKIPKRQIRIISGATTKNKVVEW